MELTHTFHVPASVDTTWDAFTDLEMVAGCFPGAALTGVDGDAFSGTVKVKLGPISLQYTGSGTFVERDAEAHRFVLEAKGKDRRGNGTAGATVTAVLTPEGPDGTNANVVTALEITGKPAQFGRGVIQDVSDRILNQFVECLESKLAGGEEAPPAAPPEVPAAEEGAAAPAVPAPEGAPPAAGAAAGEAPSPEGRPQVTATPPTAAGPGVPAEAIDLGATVLPILLKRYWREMTIGALVLVVLWQWRRRRR